MTAKGLFLFSLLLQSAFRGTMQTIQNRQNAPRPCRDPGKGRRAFLTTEPTTYSPGAHGKSAFKECYRVRESEWKRPKTSKNRYKKCFSSLRVQEAVGSNPATRTTGEALKRKRFKAPILFSAQFSPFSFPFRFRDPADIRIHPVRTGLLHLPSYVAIDIQCKRRGVVA